MLDRLKIGREDVGQFESLESTLDMHSKVTLIQKRSALSSYPNTITVIVMDNFLSILHELPCSGGAFFVSALEDSTLEGWKNLEMHQ